MLKLSTSCIRIFKYWNNNLSILRKASQHIWWLDLLKLLHWSILKRKLAFNWKCYPHRFSIWCYDVIFWFWRMFRKWHWWNWSIVVLLWNKWIYFICVSIIILVSLICINIFWKLLRSVNSTFINFSNTLLYLYALNHIVWYI
jgi:hypothetical protein